MAKSTIYLDYAAASPLDPKVLKVMEPYLKNRFYNPSANYLPAKNVRADVEKARSNVAQIMGAKPEEIIFTAGGTESDNLAVRGVMDKYPNSSVIVSAIEHEAVAAPAKRYDHKTIGVDKNGMVDPRQLKKIIDDKTVVVSIIYANNEIGTIEPIAQISKLIKAVRQDRTQRKIKLPLYFHTDACQAPAYLDLHISRLGVDLMSLNGGKIYGPKQSGILYVNRHVKLRPLVLGGGQEFGVRSGTENVASIIGFSESLKLVQARKSEESIRLDGLKAEFIKQVKSKITGVSINGEGTKTLPNNISVTFPGRDAEELLLKLEDQGVLCASGAACSANNQSISATLLAIGLSPAKAKSTLRFTTGVQTKVKDLNATIEALLSILA
ncbi:MAG TPA: cysteine desulfurase family protein [Candidatus Saccharimonadales bacterium]|nr:cysteine desulfurase family protein [Candidatus Saccharimonadales bacterium]